MMQMQHYFLPFLLPLLCTWSLSICAEAPNIPKQIKIGALFAFNSTIGRLAQPAIQLAVKDINDSPDVLNGTKLEIEMFDTGCEPLQGAATAVQLLQKGVVAVVGPQSSATAQFVAHIAKQTRVPFVSFGATDPSLSKTQYPFFFRVVPSDSLQMQAVAAFIANFGWTEVAVIYVDDDYGTNGATSLSDSLQVRGSKVVDKVALNPLIDKDGIDMQLIGLLDRQTRVFVLHTYPNVGHLILQEAYIQNMLSIGFVWIVTDLMSNSLGGAEICHNILKFAQGVIGIRQFALPTSQLGRFLMEWHDGTQTQSFDMDATCINPYLLCAYDAVWTIGRALHSFINERGMFQFKEPIKFPTQSGGMSELVQLKEFQGGNKLRALLLNTSFQGTSGFINFDGRGDIVETVFEFVNIVGKSLHPVGYWSTHGVGVSLTPPLKYSFTRTKGQDYVSDAAVTEMKMPIIWPGKSTDVPGSLVLPQNRTTLKIGVPYKVGYNEIIRVINQSSNSTRLYGFCISVFEAALHYLPFSLSYNYVLVGDGQMTPSYDDLILRLANQEFDALVGDFSIVAERLKLVDFIQPYLESGLVVLVPVRNKKNSPWAFLRPFTSHLWLTVLFSFLLTGTAIWILEHRVNEDFRGPPKTQFITVITFIFSTLFFTQKEDARSFFGRIVLLTWLFVILIINSSYTANLTSILTVEQLTPSIHGLQSLLQTSLPIGYQAGSFVYSYLRNLNVDPSRLKAYNTRRAILIALADGPSNGGIAAIVDELPYIQLFEHGYCQKFAIAGHVFTKTGWGFAFPQGSNITNYMSQAILQMAESGELDRIRSTWFLNYGCDESTDSTAHSNQLDIKNFWGLFLLSGAVSTICVLMHVFCLYRNYLKHQREDHDAVSTSKSFSEHLRLFILYADKAM